MNASSPSNEDRLWELLADEQTFGLSAEEQAELEALLKQAPASSRDEFALAAATVMLASYDERSPQALPEELRTRIAEAAPEYLPQNSAPPLNPPASSSAGPSLSEVQIARRLGWFAAAAAVLLATGIWVFAPKHKLAPAQQRAELLQNAEDLIQVSWQLGPTAQMEQAAGDVVWSNEKQVGFMRFRNLPANDPTKQQYQLWIIDGKRDPKYPVDGGVFNIPDGSDEVIVPINAKLPVFDPKLFAITVEEPGGVVVSDRKRLPLLAEVPEG